jgi:hypothetical protein
MERDDGIHTRLSAGARVTYDGQAWEVAELAPPSVLLASPAGGLRRVSISHLLAAPGTRIGGLGQQQAVPALVILAGVRPRRGLRAGVPHEDHDLRPVRDEPDPHGGLPHRTRCLHRVCASRRAGAPTGHPADRLGGAGHVTGLWNHRPFFMRDFELRLPSARLLVFGVAHRVGRLERAE